MEMEIGRADKAPKLGGSLLVPCVQELAKDPNLVKVPPRYMRTTTTSSDDELDPTAPNFLSNVDSSLSPQLPVIDMQHLSSADHHLKDSELDKLHHACKHWGFFQLINHGVSSELVESVKVGIQDLFNLPIEDKEKFWQKPDDDMEGFVKSEEQKLDWGDMFYMLTLPTHFRKPHLFPNLSSPGPLRVTLEAYSLELKRVALKLLELMAKGVGMEENDMRVLFEEGHQTMRMNYYPPCPQPECAIGLNAAHSDATALTILLQINDVEGLQIRKDGAWLPIQPLPNAFVVNVGDILEDKHEDFNISRNIEPNYNNTATTAAAAGLSSNPKGGKKLVRFDEEALAAAAAAADDHVIAANTQNSRQKLCWADVKVDEDHACSSPSPTPTPTPTHPNNNINDFSFNRENDNCHSSSTLAVKDAPTSKASAKSKLHKICAANNWKLPIYECCKEEGPSHQRLFTFKVVVEIKKASQSTILECFSDPQSKKKLAAEHAAEGALWYLRHRGYF